MYKQSYRHRRLVQEQQYGRHARRIAMEFEADGVSLPARRMHHTEGVELLLDYIDDRERAMRNAMEIMATDLVAVYKFIDDMTATRQEPGTYARGQQVAVERLQEAMSLDLRHRYDRWPDRTFMDDIYLSPPPF